MSGDWSTGRKNSTHSDPSKQSSWHRFKGWGNILVVVLGLVGQGKGALMFCSIQGCQHLQSLAWYVSKSENMLNNLRWVVVLVLPRRSK